AVGVQREMAERMQGPARTSSSSSVLASMGEIVVEDEDIFDDGVNSRSEGAASLAAPACRHGFRKPPQARSQGSANAEAGSLSSLGELPSNASSAKSSMDNLLWTFPLKSHFRTLVGLLGTTAAERLAVTRRRHQSQARRFRSPADRE